MKYKDYYSILGLQRDASQDDIKRAYRKLARKFHPDVNKEDGAATRFQEIAEAYEVLKDTDKRAAYDQFGENWQAGQNFKSPPGWDFREFTGSHNSAGASAQGFSDFFEALFGGGRTRQQTHGDFSFFENNFADRGLDLRAQIEITLEESFHGSSKSISLNRDSAQRSSGRNQLTSLQVKIPRGILEGQHIRLEGQGAQNFENGPRGNLLLEVVFIQHPIFTVKGRDITMTLPVTPWEAALGATIKVPTLGGPVDLKLPAGSQSGKKLRLKGKGISSSTVSGDQYIILAVHIPKPDTKQQKELYKEMAKIMPFNPRSTFGV